jgi:hypothetical protein
MLGGLLGGSSPQRAVEAMDTAELMATADQAYDTLDEDQQRQLRAVVTWAQNGFDLSASTDA